MPFKPVPVVRFYRSTIEGHEFVAAIGETGPFVYEKKTGKGANIGVSSILDLAWMDRLLHPKSIEETRKDKLSTNPEWAVVKYGKADEELMDIRNLSDEGRARFSREFGIPFFNVRKGAIGGDFGESFYASPAFAALCEWAKQHPRLYGRYKGTIHTPQLGEVLRQSVEVKSKPA